MAVGTFQDTTQGYCFVKKMNRKRLLDLYWELFNFLKSIHGLYLDSVAGYKLIYNYASRKQEQFKSLIGPHENNCNDELLDMMSFSHDSLYGKHYCASGIHRCKIGEVKERNSENGQNEYTISNMCIVYLYTYWESYLRKEIALAEGVLSPDETNKKKIDKILSEHISDDFWGDMRNIRRSIIHNKGKAIKELGDAKNLQWFKEGDEIALTQEMMRKIFLTTLRYCNSLHTKSLPPSKGITIPG